MPYKQSITNWGLFPVIESEISASEYESDIQAYLQAQQKLIARGNGRCYGDSSLQKHIFSSLRLNKILAFDREEGVLTCQAGVLLEDILNVILPYGWFLPVTPGTKLVTVGGAIASDVHGKNHHKEGTFGQHVQAIQLMQADGKVVTCSPEKQKDLFWATCGGMGLTGIILQTTFTLKKIETAYILQESIKTPNLEASMELTEASRDWTYSVAWIDCLAKGKKLGRSILMRGEHAQLSDLPNKVKNAPLTLPQKKPTTIPTFFPSFLLNNLSMKLFNWYYYHKQTSRQKNSIIDYDTYFYPLDNLLHWNRMYGKSGFTQYQIVLPLEYSKTGIRKILQRVASSDNGTFLSVLKLFGPAHPEALLSFPMEGYTLTMDFKIKPSLFPLLDELDQVVLEHGGRIYLAKDVRMSADFFQQTYPKFRQFQERIKSLNSGYLFQSLQSERLGLHEF